MPLPFCFVGALYVAWVFFTWVYLPSLGVFSLAGSFRCLFLFVLSARFMLLGSFLRGFIFC
jgi:hypothetical protein